MGRVSKQSLQLAMLALLACAAIGFWMGFDDAQPRADYVRGRPYVAGAASTGPDPVSAVPLSDQAVAEATAGEEEAPAASEAPVRVARAEPPRDQDGAEDEEAASPAPRTTPLVRPASPVVRPPAPRAAPQPATPAEPDDPIGDALQPPPEDQAPPF